MSNKLLLADDSITIRKVVGIIFANEDYALSVVDNGNSALEKAREIMPDIIMADVMMPGKTGYDVCVEVRRDPALKHIPLLLLSGAFEPFDEEKARQSGADDFITKPFESQQLIEKVKKLIDLGKERKMSTPVQEPAEAVVPQVMPEQLFVAPSPPPADSVNELMGGVFPQVDEVEEIPALQADELSVTEEVAEALPEDDLWDVFTLEEDAEEETTGTEAPLEEEVGVSFGGLENEEEYSFSIEEETTSLDAGPATTAAASQETESFEIEEDSFEIEEESLIAEDEPPLAEKLIGDAFEFAAGKDEASFVSGLDETPSAAAHTIPEVELQFAPEEDAQVISPVDAPLAGGVFEFAAETEAQTSIVSGLDELSPVAAPATPEVELQFAPEEEYVPVIPPAEPPAAPAPPAVPIPPAALAELAAPAAIQPAVSGEPALSEEQLASLVANISRDVIERIVWEVVPDLAETLIREEIRKLKEGLRR